MRKTSIALRFAASLVLIAYPVYGMADQSDAVTSEPSTLPKIKTSKGLYYPDRAKLLGQEGKVIVAFDIAENGQATNSSLVFSDNNLFVKPSMDFVASLSLELPKTESGTEIRQARYRIGFVFCLPPSSLDDTFAVPVIPVVVSGSRIPGAPVRNPPATGASGQCTKVLDLPRRCSAHDKRCLISIMTPSDN
jgi:TonB family protein